MHPGSFKTAQFLQRYTGQRLSTTRWKQAPGCHQAWRQCPSELSNGFRELPNTGRTVFFSWGLPTVRFSWGLSVSLGGTVCLTPAGAVRIVHHSRWLMFCEKCQSDNGCTPPYIANITYISGARLYVGKSCTAVGTANLLASVGHLLDHNRGCQRLLKPVGDQVQHLLDSMLNGHFNNFGMHWTGL